MSPLMVRVSVAEFIRCQLNFVDRHLRRHFFVTFRFCLAALSCSAREECFFEVFYLAVDCFRGILQEQWLKTTSKRSVSLYFCIVILQGHGNHPVIRVYHGF